MYTPYTQRTVLLDKISPVSSAVQVNGAGGWVSVGNCIRGHAIFQTGLIASTGTLTFQIQQATSAAGANAKPFKTATALDDTDDNLVIVVEWEAEDLDVDGGFSFIRIEAVAATAASLVSATSWAVVRFQPPSTSGIAEIVGI